MNTTLANDRRYLNELKRVEQSIRQNQLQEAATALNAMSRHNANDPRLFLLGAELALAANNAGGVLKAARQAHELAPDWSTATLYLANVLANRGEAEEAVSLAESAVSQTQNSPSGSNDPAEQIEMLLSAASIAQRFDVHAKSWRWLRDARKLNPGDSGIRNRLARTLTYMGDHAGAIEILDELISEHPDQRSLVFNRMLASIQANRMEMATQDAQTLLALEPENLVYSFYASVARGETPRTQPESLVAETFDNFAARFDDLMVIRFKYMLPRDVAAMIRDWHSDKPGDLLDLGCGTGLLGICLQPWKGALVGVDLSGKMIEAAAQHDVYHKFHQVNLLDALVHTPEKHYDVIAALDVFPYVGELSEALPNAFRILTPGGRLVFSIETHADCQGNYCLPQTYRYVHHPDYVQRLLADAGFTETTMSACTLWYETGNPVPGLLVTTRKPISTI